LYLVDWTATYTPFSYEKISQVGGEISAFGEKGTWGRRVEIRPRYSLRSPPSSGWLKSAIWSMEIA